MNKNKKLASQLAVAVAVATLVGTSAFAETRHHDGTVDRERVSRGEGRTNERHDRGGESSQREQFRNEQHQQQQTQQQPAQQSDRGSRQHDRGSRDRQEVDQRSFERNDRNFERDRNRTFDGNRNDGNRNNDRNRGSAEYRGNNRGNYDNRSGNRGTPQYYSGRISHVEHWNNGFRIYIGGSRYPFFVPSAYFRADRFRLGLSIRLGGYYNPLGYYDYYDDPYYYGGSPAYSAGSLRGVVETVDFRRGTFELRDDISGNFVTVVMRGRDRDFAYIRPGDYIEVAGDWTRGVFEGYRADILNDSRNRGY